jgi:predicted permease
VSIEAAQAILSPVLKQTVEADFGSASDTGEGESSQGDRLKLVLTPGGRWMNEVREKLAEPLFIAQVVIGLVLLIACANVATLLLARSEERRREMAVRLSLGAGRLRLIRQLLTESLMLALAGGALGLLMSQWGAKALLTLLPVSSRAGSVLRLELDAQVLGFTLLASVVTGLVFGLVPALRTSHVEPVPLLKAGGRAVGPGGTSFWGFTRGLVVAQVALSLILLVSAGLFIRSFQNLISQEPGLATEGVLLFRIDPTLNGYDDERLASLYQQILNDVQAIPGVSSATMSPFSPIGTSGHWDKLNVPGGNEVGARIRFIDHGFMETLQIPLLSGRGLSSHDGDKSALVAVVNEAFAREAYGDGNPLGREIYIRGGVEGPQVQIVGVYRDIRDLGLREGTYPAVFLPYGQHIEDLHGMTFSVRSHFDPESLLGLVRNAVKQVDLNLPLFETGTLTEKIESLVAQERQFARLSTFSGVLALLLACIGIYGTLSASVSRRIQEIGIRMALGARRQDILGSVMRGMFMVALGIGIGLSGAWALTRWLSTLLFELTAMDPLTLLAATLVLVAVAGIAVYIPARRASLVEPMVALRFE